MNFPKVELGAVKKGDLLIVRYMPMHQDRGIVATKVIEIYDRGFAYKNLPMGVQGSFDDKSLEEIGEMGLRVDELLVGLPQGFQPPLENTLVHRVGGVYVPESQRELLAQLFQDTNYQRSLIGLKSPNRTMSQRKLERVLSR